MHHVSARSIAEEHIFKDSGDYATAIRILAELVEEGLLVCHQFCFMPTHYHLFGTFTDVSAAIHKLTGGTQPASTNAMDDAATSSTRRSADSRSRQRRTCSNCRATSRSIPETTKPWPFSCYPGLIGTREPFSFVDPSPILETFGSAAAFRAYVNEGRRAEDMNLVNDQVRAKSPGRSSWSRG
jgi:hypothetical protein